MRIVSRSDTLPLRSSLRVYIGAASHRGMAAARPKQQLSRFIARVPESVVSLSAVPATRPPPHPTTFPRHLSPDLDCVANKCRAPSPAAGGRMTPVAVGIYRELIPILSMAMRAAAIRYGCRLTSAFVSDCICLYFYAAAASTAKPLNLLMWA